VHTTDSAADYTATIDWADGSSSPASIVRYADRMYVTASHTYDSAGPYSYRRVYAKVTITGQGMTDVGGLDITVKVSPPFTIAAASVSVEQGATFTGTLLTMSANHAGIDLSNYNLTALVSGMNFVWCDLNWNDQGQVVVTPRSGMTFDQSKTLLMVLSGPDVPEQWINVSIHVTAPPPMPAPAPDELVAPAVDPVTSVPVLIMADVTPEVDETPQVQPPPAAKIRGAFPPVKSKPAIVAKVTAPVATSVFRSTQPIMPSGNPSVASMVIAMPALSVSDQVWQLWGDDRKIA
jgi:hypothetical protein